MSSRGVPMRVRTAGRNTTPRTEMNAPTTSASVMAVCTDLDRRSSSRCPKNCPVMTAQPAPRPTQKPMASSESESVDWIPPSAIFPPN